MSSPTITEYELGYGFRLFVWTDPATPISAPARAVLQIIVQPGPLVEQAHYQDIEHWDGATVDDVVEKAREAISAALARLIQQRTQEG